MKGSVPERGRKEMEGKGRERMEGSRSGGEGGGEVREERKDSCWFVGNLRKISLITLMTLIPLLS